MIYIVRVYDGNDVYEYEYGNEKHAREHMEWESCRTELYAWKAGKEWLLDSTGKTGESKVLTIDTETQTQ